MNEQRAVDIVTLSHELSRYKEVESVGGVAYLASLTEEQKHLLCDPQTSGGLLVAVSPEGESEFLAVASELGLVLAPIGEMTQRRALAVGLR